MTLNNDPRPWQIESSEYLHRLPWFTVRKDAVRMQNGGYIPDYYVLEYPNWINVTAITTDGQLVMIRQYRHGLAQISYELCAGVVDPGEDPLVAAQRELLEETGFGGGNWELMMTLSANPGTHTNLSYSYLATDVTLQQAQQLESTEEISVHLVSPMRAFQLLESGEIMQALHAAPLLKYLLSRAVSSAEPTRYF
jgi:8-oxo-dGTP pyrophosphatase MutT (NUDIX family)